MDAATLLFYEDCEDAGFSEWFLERYMGTSSYWSELTSEITRSSSAPHGGSYCMTYDPWTTGNPHGNFGISTTNGNTDNFLLSAVETSGYYFRWYQRFEEGIDYSGAAENKLLYLGYGEWGGDFTFTLKKNNPDSFHITIRSNPGYTITVNTYPGNPGGVNIDDMEWHKFEVGIDLGTTGATGSYFVEIDDETLISQTSVTFRDQQNINNGVALGIIQWPSNTSGTLTGTAQTWLDDLEFYSISSLADIPSQLDTTAPVSEFSGTPLTGTAPLSVAFSDSSTNTPTKWHWDFGDAAADTSALQNPTFEYDTAGTYTVALTAYNADGSDTETKVGYVTVGAPPITGLSASVSTGALTASWTTDGAASWTVEAHPATGQSYSIWTETNSASFPVGATVYDVTVDSPDSSPATTSTGG